MIIPKHYFNDDGDCVFIQNIKSSSKENLKKDVYDFKYYVTEIVADPLTKKIVVDKNSLKKIKCECKNFEIEQRPIGKACKHLIEAEELLIILGYLITKELQ